MTAGRISEMKFKKEYLIVIILDNGEEVVYDMRPRLVSARFWELADWRIFSEGRLVNSNKVIRWNDHTEITIEEIMLQTKEY